MEKIECPHCHKKFELTDAVAGPLVAAARAEAEAGATARVEAARRSIEAEAASKAQRAQADVVAALKRETKDAADSERAMAEKLSAAQAAQVEALRKTRELDDKLREADLVVERRVTDGLLAVRRAAEEDATALVSAKLAERDLTIDGLKKTAEELRKKLEQGSTQTQGEAQELALEAALRERFPGDSVEPVGKGVAGGDCVLAVPDAGRILFESKATKAWSPSWLPKLRDDGRAAKADLLMIVTAALPRDVNGFDLVEGVWVCGPRHAVALAVALRAGLVEAAAARRAGQGAETKAALVYDYLVGPRFRARVGAIVEAFTTMKEDLDAERRAIGKAWAKREAQIGRVLDGTTGLYGDLQAIAGRSLAEVEGLDVARLGGPE